MKELRSTAGLSNPPMKSTPEILSASHSETENWKSGCWLSMKSKESRKPLTYTKLFPRPELKILRRIEN